MRLRRRVVIERLERENESRRRAALHDTRYTDMSVNGGLLSIESENDNNIDDPTLFHQGFAHFCLFVGEE